MAVKWTHRLLLPTVKMEIDFLASDVEPLQHANPMMQDSGKEDALEVKGPDYIVQMSSNEEFSEPEEEEAKEPLLL
ncbi:hypothetical protein GOP47_0029801 [Adiantum capillus-veneris]|nr:hypothetical protein GOP47_0029801 [Adiantum capillus-veneris]